MSVIDMISIGWTALALIFLAAQASADAKELKKEQKLPQTSRYKVKK